MIHLLLHAEAILRKPGSDQNALMLVGQLLVVFHHPAATSMGVQQDHHGQSATAIHLLGDICRKVLQLSMTNRQGIEQTRPHLRWNTDRCRGGSRTGGGGQGSGGVPAFFPLHSPKLGELGRQKARKSAGMCACHKPTKGNGYFYGMKHMCRNWKTSIALVVLAVMSLPMLGQQTVQPLEVKANRMVGESNGIQVFLRYKKNPQMDQKVKVILQKGDQTENWTIRGIPGLAAVREGYLFFPGQKKGAWSIQKNEVRLNGSRQVFRPVLTPNQQRSPFCPFG